MGLEVNARFVSRTATFALTKSHGILGALVTRVTSGKTVVDESDHENRRPYRTAVATVELQITPKNFWFGTSSKAGLSYPRTSDVLPLVRLPESRG